MNEDEGKAFELLAKIKLMIDNNNQELMDENMNEMTDGEMLDIIYDLITEMLPSKYLIAERLELDDRERKLLEELKKRKI